MYKQNSEYDESNNGKSNSVQDNITNKHTRPWFGERTDTDRNVEYLQKKPWWKKWNK